MCPQPGVTVQKFFVSAVVSLLLTANTALAANSELSCKLGLLKDLGWQIQSTTGFPGVQNGNACESVMPPVFTYNTSTENDSDLLARANSAMQSITTRCLVNRQYIEAIKVAIVNLTANKEFEFIQGGADPRDPFVPPDDNWASAGNRGYDLPSGSISSAIDSLYTKPFIAECAAATQIAQLAILKEHYGVFTDAMIQPTEVGIGIWPEYIKAPAIAAHEPLLLDSRQRKRALKSLATLGKGAFYGQSGYLKPYKGDDFVDSIDNRGQNFVIVELTDNAVNSIRKQSAPLKAFNKISRKIWKKYRKKLKDEESDIETLSSEMREELESADPFFKDIMVYVHPLSVRNFAFHIARQFKWNPRTPYVFEVYEDFQSGYFHQRYIDYRLRQCQQQAYCRKADSGHYYLTDETGIPSDTVYGSAGACEADLAVRPARINR
jgi:hypothetical protein